MKSISHISDQIFFGKWDIVSEKWITEGKLNYSYSKELAEVERCVKNGDYYSAKESLLSYYRNRTSIPRADFDMGIMKECVLLNKQDVFNFQEPYMTSFNVENAGEYREYKIDLGVTRNSVFLLSSFDKTEDLVCIGSRESEYSPSLEIDCGDGTAINLYPIRDTYIRAFDETADYSKENYGRSKELYVKDSFHQFPDGRFKPYSSKTRRAYIAFDSEKIPAKVTKVYLKLYAKIVPEEGVAQVTESSHEIHVFSAYNKSWAEHKDEKSSFNVMTWAAFRIAHYSWKGVPGGFDWIRPDNCPSEYITYNTRFYGITSIAIEGVRNGDNSYIERSIDMTLDFIQDTAGKIEVENVPPKRDIESADRCCRMPGLFAAFLDYEGFSAEAMTDILKWLWEEMTYLYNGAGCLYVGATAKPTENNYAETNRGLWHVKATEGICAYFPEYTDRNEWKRVADDRLNTVAHVLVNDDGCYQEATFGYATAMVSFFLTIYKYLQHSGDPVPAWFNSRLHNFMRYLMYNSYPNHQTTFFGEGGVPNTVGALKHYLTLTNDDELRYVVTDGADGTKPQKTAAYFKQLKTAACRTGWSTKDSMIFMTAKNGGNHNHKDSLMLTFFAGDKELLADTGMTSYDGLHPHFKWQRHTTRSHNTVEVDGNQQRGSDFLYNYNPALPNGESYLKIYPGKTVDKIEAWTDANEGIRHYRNVSYIKNRNFIIVSDMLSPNEGDTAVHTYTQNWHTFAPHPSYPVIDNGTKIGKTNYQSGSNLYVAQVNPKGITLTLEEGYSALSSSPTRYFCYAQQGAGDVMFNTLLYPFYNESEIPKKVQNIDTGIAPTKASAMEISLPEKDGVAHKVFYYNSFEENPSKRAFDKYTIDASSAVILQNNDNTLSTVSMYNGSCLLIDGYEIISSDARLTDIEITFEDKTAIITSEDEAIEAARIMFAASGEITGVLVNGKAVSHNYSEGKVYIRNKT